MSLFCNSFHSSEFLLPKIAPRQMLSFLYPVNCFKEVQELKVGARRESRRRSQVPSVSNGIGFETWFIRSLASAGHCRKHSLRSTDGPSRSTFKRPQLLGGKSQLCSTEFLRHQHTARSLFELIGDRDDFDGHRNTTWLEVDELDENTDKLPESEGHGETEEPVHFAGPEPPPNRTREELMALVDQYGGESYTDQLPLIELPRLYQPSDGPYLTVSDKPEDEWPPADYTWPADPATKLKIQGLALGVKDFSKDPEEIYQLYRALPAPRAPYLDSRTRHRMLRHLAVVERKDEHSMLRYLSVLDDMKQSAIPLTSEEWTSAISFAARYVTTSTEVEVEAALHMWREMEHTAGVRGTEATFNVLFDVACKAGKFTLAEMIYKEMEARGLESDRYHHVSLIFYYGLQRNGDGARAAYRGLVEAGEIVDTVVLNAMISALIRSHEPNAAENIYQRMKKDHVKSGGRTRLPPKNFKERRFITRTLMNWARIAKNYPEQRESFQRQAIITPDVHTFRILVNYFAVEAGELDQTAKFLEEMKWFKLPLHGALFNALLKGFALHGGVRYSHWTERRLESVWKSLLEVLDDKVEGLYVSKWMVTWALRAFAKCSGNSRALVAWEEIKEKWDPGEEEMSFVMSNLRQLLDRAETPNQDWYL